MVGCSYEVVGCGWVGGGSGVLWGGRCERALFRESAGGDSEHESAANRFRAKSAKTD